MPLNTTYKLCVHLSIKKKFLYFILNQTFYDGKNSAVFEFLFVWEPNDTFF